MKAPFLSLPLMIITTSATLLTPVRSEESDKLNVPDEIRAAVFTISTDKGRGTGFACNYRDQEFIATNLHVVNGTKAPVIRSQGGFTIPLQGRVIVANDADVCLLSVGKPFSDFGIVPLELASNVQKDTSPGDDVYCLGNSLGNGVVIQSDGKLKGYGGQRLETTARFVGGNSGGPLIDLQSGKVIGLVTETQDNTAMIKQEGKRLAKAIESDESEVEEVAFFAHRVDTVQQWSGTTIQNLLAVQEALEKHTTSFMNTFKFLADAPGWKSDQDLYRTWTDYQKFMDDAAARTSSSVRRTNYIDEYGNIVHTSVKVRSKSVSQADYDAAWDKFQRRLEWRASSDVNALQKLKPLGYIQKADHKIALENAKWVQEQVARFTK